MAATLRPPERQHARTLPDGRVLAWSEWGPLDGRPVLFCTGAGTSGRLGFGAGHLAPLGLRLLGIDRPGLGRSDDHPAGTLCSWAGDVATWVRAEGLREPLAVGFSQGAPFALALAAEGVARAVAIVSGQDDLRHPALLPRLHPDVRVMVEAAEHHPEELRRSVAGAASREWLWEMIRGMSSEEDRAVYAAPDFAEAWGLALQEGFARGAGPYARDLVNALGPWPFAVEGIRVPVDLWYGARDASPVHSPDRGATLASRLPDARLEVDPGRGGSLLWTRSRDILARLRERADPVPSAAP